MRHCYLGLQQLDQLDQLLLGRYQNRQIQGQGMVVNFDHMGMEFLPTLCQSSLKLITRECEASRRPIVSAVKSVY